MLEATEVAAEAGDVSVKSLANLAVAMLFLSLVRLAGLPAAVFC